MSDRTHIEYFNLLSGIGNKTLSNIDTIKCGLDVKYLQRVYGIIAT